MRKAVPCTEVQIMVKRDEQRNRSWGMTAVAVFLFIAVLVIPAAAVELPAQNGIYLPVINNQRDSSGNYYFNIGNGLYNAGQSGDVCSLFIDLMVHRFYELFIGKDYCRDAHFSNRLDDPFVIGTFFQKLKVHFMHLPRPL